MRYIYLSLAAVLMFSFTGCSVVIQKHARSDAETIAKLKRDLSYKEQQYQIKQSELSELKKIKSLLEQRLKQEIANKEVSLNLTGRGVVITLASDIFFDSGKANIRKDLYPVLDKVAYILKNKIADRNIGIEGHTDNEPIKRSGWKSNWELSLARAVNVLHYLEKKGVKPQRLTAIGYGQYHPIADNSTPEGRRLNRRVEIVILPVLKKVSPEQIPVKGKNVVQGGEEMELK